MDENSEGPAASMCKTTDGQTTAGVFEKYIQLNEVPKTTKKNNEAYRPSRAIA